MEIVNGKVILSQEACHCAWYPRTAPLVENLLPGQVWQFTYCQNRTKAQGLHNCTKKSCPNNRSGKQGWHEISKKAVTCSNCKGTGLVNETVCSRINVPESMPILVFRNERANSFNESYLGMGCLYSSTDYGQAYKATDDEVRARVFNNGRGTQVCNIVRGDDLTLCDAIAVYVTTNGYSVRAYFADKGEKKFLGATEDESIAAGQAIAKPLRINPVLVAGIIE